MCFQNILIEFIHNITIIEWRLMLLETINPLYYEMIIIPIKKNNYYNKLIKKNTHINLECLIHKTKINNLNKIYKLQYQSMSKNIESINYVIKSKLTYKKDEINKENIINNIFENKIIKFLENLKENEIIINYNKIK